MKNSLLNLSLIFSIMISIMSFGQNTGNEWRKTPNTRIVKSKGKRPIIPNEYLLYQTDFDLLKSLLNKAPKEKENNNSLLITIPSPKGMTNFLIRKTGTLSKGAEVSGADIQTFFGYNEANKNEWITLDYTNHGFHAMVTGGPFGAYFIDPYQIGDTENYLVYYKKDLSNEMSHECFVQDEDVLDGDQLANEGKQVKSAIETDCQLRTYRIAIACTGEYVAYHGGTQALAQSSIVTTIDRVNQIFRRDLGVVLNIVSGSSIIYTDSNTDPYVNGDIYQMLDTNAYVVPNMVGSANFDIGHVFGTAGLFSGGLASRDGVCQPGDKSGGVTTLEDPIGDPFDIDFVAHEIGHQIGGRHTFNAQVGACAGWLQRSELGAYEPGSGSTIMAYAGLCNQPGLSADVQNFSDALFHSYSIQEISKSLITGNGSECGMITPTINIKPSADAGPVFYNVPISTPFQLTGNAVDANPGDVHTYSWEQYDLAPSAQNIPDNTSIDQPNFRTFEPSINKTRYFPRIDSIIANVNWPKFEQIPSVSREMKFRLTVRDNSANGCGCTDFDEIDINFHASAGPFLVTQPNTTGISWSAGNTETISWNVAGTDNAPINCSNVDILLSTDGGYTYPHTLALNVSNNGTYNVNVPNLNTTSARLKIICSDNVFFDISDYDFSIIPLPITEPEISFETTVLEVFEESDHDGNLDCRPYKDYPIVMQIANPPNGDAIVTIGSGGDATNGYDYQILGSPVVFPNGSTATQSFTIRIIDDGEVDPLENLELSYSISGGSNAVPGNNDQICLVKIHDDEHAPFSGELPHYEENFDLGINFGTGNTDWDNSNNLGAETWILGSNGELSGVGQSLYISDNGVSNSYNTSNSYNYVSIESEEINGTGRTNQVLSFEYVSEGDEGHDFGRVMYNTGFGNNMIEGGNNAPFVGVANKRNAVIPLPSQVDGVNYRIGWGWTNSVTNPGGQTGKGFEIDNIKITEGTPGIRIENDITTVAHEEYLGPYQSIYFYDPNDGNLMVYIQNTSNHDYGCTRVEVDRAGNNATEFQYVNSSLDVTDKSYRVIPTNNNPSGSYDITLYYTEDEISGWENATGNNRNDLKIVKTIGPISNVTPANPQFATTFYQAATLGTFGQDITLTSSFNNGFSGFAAGINNNPLPIGLLSFEATIIDNRYVKLDWATVSETNNDYFTIQKTNNGIDWINVANVDGAGNSSITLNYTRNDMFPFPGLSYYRLKQTDFDGSYKYSNIRSVNFEQNEIQIYPSLVEESFIIQGPEEELLATQVYNSAGQNITTNLSYEWQSTEMLKINVNNLSSGMYYVKTKTNVSKVIKK